MTYNEIIKFIESTGFSKRVYDYLDDDEYSRLQWAMLGRPEAGAVIPNSGGIRKLRWAAAGQGKRGGLRVLYYWRPAACEIWLLAIYAKSETGNPSPVILQALRNEIKGW